MVPYALSSGDSCARAFKSCLVACELLICKNTSSTEEECDMGETPKISRNSAMGAVPGGRELIPKRASVISLSEASDNSVNASGKVYALNREPEGD